MDLGIPTLEIKSMLESNLPKSRFSVRGLTVLRGTRAFRMSIGGASVHGAIGATQGATRRQQGQKQTL